MATPIETLLAAKIGEAYDTTHPGQDPHVRARDVGQLVASRAFYLAESGRLAVHASRRDAAVVHGRQLDGVTTIIESRDRDLLEALQRLDAAGVISGVTFHLADLEAE